MIENLGAQKPNFTKIDLLLCYFDTMLKLIMILIGEASYIKSQLPPKGCYLVTTTSLQIKPSIVREIFAAIERKQYKYDTVPDLVSETKLIPPDEKKPVHNRKKSFVLPYSQSGLENNATVSAVYYNFNIGSNAGQLEELLEILEPLKEPLKIDLYDSE